MWTKSSKHGWDGEWEAVTRGWFALSRVDMSTACFTAVECKVSDITPGTPPKRRAPRAALTDHIPEPNFQALVR